MKAIHVQLADEGGIVVVLEQLGNKFICKLIFVKDNEGLPVI